MQINNDKGSWVIVFSSRFTSPHYPLGCVMFVVQIQIIKKLYRFGLLLRVIRRLNLRPMNLIFRYVSYYLYSVELIYSVPLVERLTVSEPGLIR